MHRSLLRIAFVAGTSVAVLLGPSGAARADVRPAEQPSARVTGAPAAPPGTLAVLGDDQVYVSRPDGTGLRRLTSDGTWAKPYRSVSVSRAGLVVAVRGDALVLLRLDGTVVRRIRVPRGHLFAPGPGTVSVTGPVDAVVSPDGSRIAYTQQRVVRTGDQLVAQTATGFTAATALSPVARWGIASGYAPSWVSRGRVLLTGSGNGSARLHDLGAVGTPAWFSSDQVGDPSDFTEVVGPELDPAGDEVVYATTDGRIVTATVSGDPRTGTPPPPVARCAFRPTGAPLTSPSYSPRGDSIVYAVGGTIVVATDLDGPCDQVALTPVLTAGASAPAWSAAPYRSVLRATSRPRVRGRPVVGALVRVAPARWSATPARVRTQWLRDGRPVRGATARTYRVRPGDRGHRISVRMTAVRPDYYDATVTARAVLVPR